MLPASVSVSVFPSSVPLNGKSGKGSRALNEVKGSAIKFTSVVTGEKASAGTTPPITTVTERTAALSLASPSTLKPTTPRVLKPKIPWCTGVSANSAEEALAKIFDLPDPPGFIKLCDGGTATVKKANINGQLFAVKISRADTECQKDRIPKNLIKQSYTLEKGEISGLSVPCHPNIVHTHALLMINIKTAQYHLICNPRQIPGKDAANYSVRASILDLATKKDLFFYLHDRYHGGGPCISLGLKVAIAVCDALRHLHDHGLVYRDLKPENVMYDDKTGAIKLIDLGLSKPLEKGEFTHTFCGSPEYLAPETLLEKPYDHHVDNWALGLLICEVCFGKNPLYDISNFNTYESIKRYSAMNQTQKKSELEKHFWRLRYSPELLDIIVRLTEKNPAERMTLEEASSKLKALQQK